jgi:hypothetical protein
MVWLQKAVNNHFSKASYAVCSVATRVGKHSNGCTNGQEYSGVYLIMLCYTSLLRQQYIHKHFGTD